MAPSKIIPDAKSLGHAIGIIIILQLYNSKIVSRTCIVRQIGHCMGVTL